MYKRSEYQVIMNRLKEQRKFIQVVMGTRQIGKPTVIKHNQIQGKTDSRSGGN